MPPEHADDFHDTADVGQHATSEVSHGVAKFDNDILKGVATNPREAPSRR
jgi:hypothetical protein